MKLLNIIIREIITYLEFKDLVKSELAFVNKQFYSNIVADNELLRRMIDINLPLIKDYSREEKYLQLLSDKYHSRQPSYGPEECKLPSLSFTYLSSYSSSKLGSLLSKALLKPFRQALVWGFRTTGGWLQSKSDLARAFLIIPQTYYSDCSSPTLSDPTPLIWITGIPILWPQGDLQKMKGLLSQIKGIQEKLGWEGKDQYERVDRWRQVTEGQPWNEDFGFPKEAKWKDEDVASDDGELLGYWYLDRMVYSLAEGSEGVGGGDDRKVEFDILAHQEFMKDRLFLWDGYKVMITERSDRPIKALAVFTHDYPIDLENHPMVHIVKDLYQKFEKSSTKKHRSESQEYVYISTLDSKPTFIFENTPEPEITEFSKKLSELSSQGILSKIIKSEINNYEFSQRFYSDQFTQDGNILTSEELEGAVDFLDHPQKYSELYQNLEDGLDLFRVRLASIAFDLETHYRYTNIRMGEVKTGRFVSVVGLDNTTDYPNMRVNTDRAEESIDIGGVVFNGTFVPNVVTGQE